MIGQAAKILGSILAATVFAVFSMSCCLAPLLFILFGISASSLSFLGFLAPYRAIFIAIAVLSLIYGFWKLYISKKPFCSGGRIVNKNLLRALFWALAAISLAALLYPCIDGIIFTGDVE